MTGHGHASGRHGDLAIDVEVRAVNNRFLKVHSKVSEVAAAIEVDLEGLVRQQVRRGTVQVGIRVATENRSNASRICTETLQSYVEQAQAVTQRIGVLFQLELGSLLQLPGVLESPAFEDAEALLASVTNVLQSALLDLNRMRLEEGKSMANQLQRGLAELQSLSAEIEKQCPVVLEEYQRRLETRLRKGLASLGQPVQELDLLREVLLHTDRCDIREELVRLTSHIDQFSQSMLQEESQGRRLDFLIQELFREINTIGSKANDAAIAHHVVGMKTVLEQMRELVQNIE